MFELFLCSVSARIVLLAPGWSKSINEVRALEHVGTTLWLVGVLKFAHGFMPCFFQILLQYVCPLPATLHFTLGSMQGQGSSWAAV